MKDSQLIKVIKEIDAQSPSKIFISDTVSRIQRHVEGYSGASHSRIFQALAVPERRLLLLLLASLIVAAISLHVYQSREDDLERLDGMALTSSLVM